MILGAKTKLYNLLIRVWDYRLGYWKLRKKKDNNKTTKISKWKNIITDPFDNKKKTALQYCLI